MIEYESRITILDQLPIVSRKRALKENAKLLRHAQHVLDASKQHHWVHKCASPDILQPTALQQQTSYEAKPQQALREHGLIDTHLEFCPEYSRLLKELNRLGTQLSLISSKLSPSQCSRAEYRNFLADAGYALDACKRAKIELQLHIAVHGCNDGKNSTKQVTFCDVKPVRPPEEESAMGMGYHGHGIAVELVGQTG